MKPDFQNLLHFHTQKTDCACFWNVHAARDDKYTSVKLVCCSGVLGKCILQAAVESFHSVVTLH